MKTSVISVLVVGAAVGALSFASRPDVAGAAEPAGAAALQGGDPKDAKKDALTQDLEALRMKCDALGAELAETKTTLEQVVHYLDLQAQSAKAMGTVLDDSEEKGFTFGINPDSRTVLLKGWRDQLAALQKDVPALKAAKKDPAAKPAARN